jgi:hypothetical protein
VKSTRVNPVHAIYANLVMLKPHELRECIAQKVGGLTKAYPNEVVRLKEPSYHTGLQAIVLVVHPML